MGEPLDVHLPLRSAREHATKSLLGWLLPVAAVLLIAQSMPGLFGWPKVAYRVDGEVIETRSTSDGTLVTFEASGDGKTVRWGRLVDDSGWSVGEPLEGWVDSEGVYYGGYGLKWLGPIGFLFSLLAGMFLFYAARRLFAIYLARWDLAHTSDPPVRGYVAAVDNPLPRTMRDVLLVWHEHPGSPPQLRGADLAFISDEETGEHLRSEPGEVLIWEAWIGTGRFAWSQPRWIGVRDGILIPHRRALLAGWAARTSARRREPSAPVPMQSGPPSPAPIATGDYARTQHSFPKMLASRTVAVIAFAVLAGLVENGDAVVSVVS